MQRISRSDQNARGRNSSLRRTRRAETPATKRTAPALGVATLALPCPHALPSLAGAPIEYHHEEGAKLLYEFCAALVHEGLGTVESWRECGEKCLVFAKQAITRGIGEERWNLLCRNVDFHVTITDSVDSYGGAEPISGERLAVTIESSGCGFIKLGPAIRALEQEAEGLGGAFYWELIHTCYRVMRIYDHQDALQYEEGMREMAKDEEDAEQQFEFPEVEKALPESIRSGVKVDIRKVVETSRHCLKQARTGRYKSWLTRLRRMQRLGRLHVVGQPESFQDVNYDSPPLPSFLLAFEERDAITACFDEEGQYMLEGSCEPALLVYFDPRNRTEFRAAIRSVARFLLFNLELCALAEELVQWEKNDGNQSLDRSNPPVRAA